MNETPRSVERRGAFVGSFVHSFIGCCAIVVVFVDLERDERVAMPACKLCRLSAMMQASHANVHSFGVSFGVSFDTSRQFRR